MSSFRVRHEIQHDFKVMRAWIPDQVRHDEENSRLSGYLSIMDKFIGMLIIQLQFSRFCGFNYESAWHVPDRTFQDSAMFIAV